MVGSCVSPQLTPGSLREQVPLGQLLTEHDNIALQEGASEDKTDLVGVIGSDEGRLPVLEAVGPVLKLIEVHRCARICGRRREPVAGTQAGGSWSARSPTCPDLVPQTCAGR